MNSSEFAQTIRDKFPGSYDHVDDQTLTGKILEKYPQYSDRVTIDSPQPQGMGSMAWEALGEPEKVSRQGFSDISNAIPQPEPTGNLPMDVIKGTPSILGKSFAETAGKVAPGFISPVSLALMGGGAVVKGVSKIPLVRKGAEALGRGAAGAIEKTTGISGDSVRSVFQKPLSLFTAPTKDEVSAAYSQSEIPSAASSAHEMISEGTGSHAAIVKRGGRMLKDYIETGNEDPRSILRGRKALDKQIGVLETQIDASRGAGRSALLHDKQAKLNLRSMFNRGLDKMAPRLREADAVASQILAVAPFRHLTLPGKINFLSPEGVMRAVPGLPTAVGLGVSGAGGVAKGVGAAIENAPTLGASLGSLIASYNTPEEVRNDFRSGKIDRPTAKKILQQKFGHK